MLNNSMRFILMAAVFFASSPAFAGAEESALADLVAARLAAALKGEGYTITKTCTPSDCSLIIE